MKESELVKKAQRGDSDAFCELYNLYKNRLYKYAYYRLSNANDAEDAVMDCVLSAYSQIHKLKKQTLFLRGYLKFCILLVLNILICRQKAGQIPILKI